MRKVPNKTCYRVSKKSTKKSRRVTRKVFAKCSTRANAMKQIRLLRALEYNKSFTFRRR